MAEISNKLVHDVLRPMLGQLSLIGEAQRTVRDELQALRVHQLALQKDIGNIYNRLDLLDARIERLERRAEMREAAE